jgi:hypothetical protein
MGYFVGDLKGVKTQLSSENSFWKQVFAESVRRCVRHWYRLDSVLGTDIG